MKLQQRIKRITSMCGFDFESIQHKAALLDSIVEKSGIPRLPVLVGFDINGPLVSTKDASLTPYEGTFEALKFLASFDRVHLCIVTGWDLNTTKYFVENILKLKGISIVSEKGMLYYVNGEVYHVYPNSDEEIIKFAESLFDIAQNHELQIAVQSNESSGCQCVYFEGFRRGNVERHPLNRERIPSLELLIQFFRKRRIRYDIEQGYVYVKATLISLYELLRHDLPFFPVRFLKPTIKNQDGWKLKVDLEDDEKFGWEQLLQVGHEISIKTERKADPNNDFCIDFTTLTAERGGFSKNKAMHLVGERIFNSTFSVFNVGDKPDDRIEGQNTLFFPQERTTATDVKINIAFPVIDGREYALIASMFFLNQQRGTC